jgi:glycylpeptide N-tetradecanoyltransferase
VAQDATELKNEEHGPFEVKTLADVSKDPYPLPDQFVWSDCDVQDPKTVRQLSHSPPLSLSLSLPPSLPPSLPLSPEYPRALSNCPRALQIGCLAQLDEVYSLLSKNYVEDGDSVFRFDYSREFLLWALTPPGFTRTFHIGVRVKE